MSEFMHDKSALFKNQEDKNQAMRTIANINRFMNLLYLLIKEHEPTKADAFTHLSALEHDIAELSKLTGYDSMIAKDHENRHKEIRQANIRIRELESLIGDQISGKSVCSAIKHWENMFRTWYEAAGFHYTITSVTEAGLRAEFTEELYKEPHERDRHIDPEIKRAIQNKTQLITKSHEFDIEKGRFHDALLDTDKNRKNLIKLFTETFPGARINKFESVVEYENYVLHFDVLIPWDAFDTWAEKLKN